MVEIEITGIMTEAEIEVEQGTALKAGDTLPVFKAQLLDNGEPYDLTDKTAELHMNEEGTDTSSKTVDGEQMTVNDATSGQVEYQWSSTETETQGDYNLEVVVIDDTSSNERTFPTNGFINVRIYDDLQ